MAESNQTISNLYDSQSNAYVINDPRIILEGNVIDLDGHKIYIQSEEPTGLTQSDVGAIWFQI